MSSHTKSKFSYGAKCKISLLEQIFKKMGSTEIVVSSVRPSVRPSVRLSVRPSVRPSPISQPLLHLESWNFQHKSVALQWSIVRSGILGPWPRSPGIWPWPGPLPKKLHFYKHNSSSCGSNWTNEGSFRS
jgi:hypothetical protein